MKFLRIAGHVINLDHLSLASLGDVEADPVELWLAADDTRGPASMMIADAGTKADIRAYFKPDRPGGPTMNGDRVGGLKVLGPWEPTP